MSRTSAKLVLFATCLVFFFAFLLLQKYEWLPAEVHLPSSVLPSAAPTPSYLDSDVVLSIAENKSKRKDSEKTVPPKKKPYYDVIVMIISNPSKRELRDQLRSTFMKEEIEPTPTIKYLFALGFSKDIKNETIIEEMEKNKDVVFLNHAENYQQLTKKVKAGFDSVYENYNFTYLWKIDDDSFVRPMLLQKKMREFPRLHGTKSIFAGYILREMPVLKQAGHPNSDFGYKDSANYLPYMSGAGYMLSYDLVEHLSTSSIPLRYLVNEDVSVGFWLAAHEIKRVDQGNNVIPIGEAKLCDNTSHKWYIMHYVRNELITKCYETFIKSKYDKQNIKSIAV